MAYTKAIIYGDTIEVYSYEKNIRTNEAPKRGVSSRANRSLFRDVGTTGETIRRQKRQDNITRSVRSFRRLVKCQLGFSDAPILASVTYADNQSDPRTAYKDWNAFSIAMRGTFGAKFVYIAVPEFQKRGAIHFHALFWGLPKNISSEEREFRTIARLWGHGFVDLIQTDGNEKLSSYLAKYMSKAYGDERLFGFRAYRCSRNVQRPVIEKNLGGLAYLQEVYGVGGDNSPVQDVSFSTKWLGKGRFRLYKFNCNNTNANRNTS